MQPTPKTSQTAPQSKISRNASITGIVLAILSLISSGIANLTINAKYSPTGPTTGSVEAEAGHAVATGTTSVLVAMFGLPFLVGAIGLGLLSLVFIAIRIPKLRVAGFIISALALAIVVWSISMAVCALDMIKADLVD